MTMLSNETVRKLHEMRLGVMAEAFSTKFLSLTELNQEIREKLEAFNHKPFQKREGNPAYPQRWLRGPRRLCREY